MIAGTGSGCGKTTITCAVLSLLKRKKLEVAAFKCGPDYIDPMFHSKVIGAKSRNLDIFLCGEDMVKQLFYKTASSSDISVMEGVMGIYDGLGGNTSTASANHLAMLTKTPEILVVNAKGLSLSLVALISGYLNFEQNNIKGVILNQSSKGMYPFYKDMIEKHLNGIKVYGYLPPIKEAEIGSRHLGLLTPSDILDLNAKLDKIADIASETLDIEGIITLAEAYQDYSHDIVNHNLNKVNTQIKIAVARDNAFCFYYEDALTLLKELGAELVYFSPLEDSALPEGISAIYLGGGYPEEYLPELSQNKALLTQIKHFIDNGLPTFAECGGFIYLNEHFITADGAKYPLVGAISADSALTDKLVRFGYKTLTANSDSILMKKGERINCHEFHYSDSTDYGSDITATKGSRSHQCIHARDNLFAGYPHIHLCGNIKLAENFITAALNYSMREKGSM